MDESLKKIVVNQMRQAKILDYNYTPPFNEENIKSLVDTSITTYLYSHSEIKNNIKIISMLEKEIIDFIIQTFKEKQKYELAIKKHKN